MSSLAVHAADSKRLCISLGQAHLSLYILENPPFNRVAARYFQVQNTSRIGATPFSEGSVRRRTVQHEVFARVEQQAEKRMQLLLQFADQILFYELPFRSAEGIWSMAKQ